MLGGAPRPHRAGPLPATDPGSIGPRSATEGTRAVAKGRQAPWSAAPEKGAQVTRAARWQHSSTGRRRPPHPPSPHFPRAFKRSHPPLLPDTSDEAGLRDWAGGRKRRRTAPIPPPHGCRGVRCVGGSVTSGRQSNGKEKKVGANNSSNHAVIGSLRSSRLFFLFL